MRSFLFVPGNSQRKFESARRSAADALILDLEDSVGQEAKPEARKAVAAMLHAPREGKRIYVRVNAFDTGLTALDLAESMPGKPDGIMLPKCENASDVRRLGHMLDALEPISDVGPGDTRIIGIVTETASSLFGLGSYRGCSARLWGIMWGAEDLATSLGASINRDAHGYFEQYRLARHLCLVAAAAAAIVPIDAVATNIDDLPGLTAESQAAQRDGFRAKAVIHPKHVEIVNAAFAPADDAVALARRVIAAFEAAGNAGAVRMGGQMLDLPHLNAARKILKAASQGV